MYFDSVIIFKILSNSTFILMDLITFLNMEKVKQRFFAFSILEFILSRNFQ